MKKKFSINTLIPIMSFLILFCVFLIATRGTLVTPQNISNIVSQAFPVIIGGTGVLFVTAMGSTDLSVGANAALSATLGAMAASHLGTWAIFPVAIGTGMLVGALNGLWNSRCKMPSFMMTLLIGLRGLLNYFLASNLIYAPTVLITFNTFPVKLAIVAVLVVIFYYVFEYTKIGYYCRAIGENERTVIATGINVKRIRMTAFIISGFMAALFGIMQIVNVGGSTNSLCQFMEMRIQMAIFLGGVSVTGGFSARIYKLLIGSFTIVMIENGLTLCGVDSTLSSAIQGILLMLVLFATIYFERRSVASKIHHAVNAANA
mgnify:CR=1 FL=1